MKFVMFTFRLVGLHLDSLILQITKKAEIFRCREFDRQSKPQTHSQEKEKITTNEQQYEQMPSLKNSC